MLDELPVSIGLQPLPRNVETDASKMLAMMSSMEVTDEDTYRAANEEVRLAKQRWEGVEKIRTDFVAPLNKHVKMINDFFRGPLDALKNAEKIGKDKMLAYRDQQERLRAEEQRKIEERAAADRREAERKAREIQEKAEAEARKKREEEERQRRAADEAAAKAREAREREEKARREGDERARKKAEEEAREQERLRREAETRERAAREQAAETERKAQEKSQQVLDQAASMPADAPQSEVPKADGQAVKKVYDVEVVDLSALVKACAEGKVPVECLQPELKVLRRAAQAFKGNLNYPGVKVIESKSLAVRA